MGNTCLRLFRGHPATENTAHDNAAHANAEPAKVYSWDKKRATLNVKDFIIDGLNNETVGRMPGAVNGEQLVVENCQDCVFYLLDWLGAVNFERCKRCVAVIGPTRGSVFLRECTDCRLAVSCGQFRVRDCTRVDIFLLCKTQPIVESSVKLRFGCLSCAYDGFKDHLHSAELSVFDNSWSEVHDFTPETAEQNYALFQPGTQPSKYITEPSGEPYSTLKLTFDPSSSLVPLTLGKARRESDEVCLVAFFHDQDSTDRALKFISAMSKAESAQKASPTPELPDSEQTDTDKLSSFVLVRTRQLSLSPEEASEIFLTEKYAEPVRQGPVIGLEYCGTNCVEKCKEVAQEVVQESLGVVYVSPDDEAAQRDAEQFCNFGLMQLTM